MDRMTAHQQEWLRQHRKKPVAQQGQGSRYRKYLGNNRNNLRKNRVGTVNRARHGEERKK